MTTRKHRHHDEPAVGQLIVTDHSVAVVVRFTRAAEAPEERVRRDGAVDDLSVLPENRHAGVDDLEDVIAAHGNRVVGRVACFPAAVRALEANAYAVEARDKSGSRPASLLRLFDGTPR